MNQGVNAAHGAGLPPLLVVALGGNAIQNPRGDDSVAGDFARTAETARRLVDLIDEVESIFQRGPTHEVVTQSRKYLPRSRSLPIAQDIGCGRLVLAAVPQRSGGV